MFERLRNNRKDQGFTLIELLVVMIIVGILAAIAIPIFMSQREKAEDTALRSDLKTLGTEISTYFVDGTGDPAPAIVGDRYEVNGRDVGPVSGNVTWGGWEVGTGSTDWCVWLQNTEGSADVGQVGVSYSAQDGLTDGDTC